MRRVFLSTVLIVVAAVSFAYGQQQGYNTTEAQQNFTESVKALPDVIQASWQSPLDFWVYADGVNKDNAESMTEKVILLAQSEYGQSLCVHIHNGDFNPLLTKCWSSL